MDIRLDLDTFLKKLKKKSYFNKNYKNSFFLYENQIGMLVNKICEN